jgi:glycosyltransferase involved in cell wall biosynthesis
MSAGCISRDGLRVAPRVSVIVANYNGGAFLADAIGSVCRQTLRDIEIIVVDDGSTDNSREIVAALRREDQRIHLLTAGRNGGPAAARNRALAVATGEWIAVFDSDDLMHPHRLSALVGAAENDQADVVADDLLIFDNRHVDPPQTLLGDHRGRAPFWLDLNTFVRQNALYGRGITLGCLKPLFRSSFLKKVAVVYDERMRVAEDFDFAFRLLQHGAKFRIYPMLLYFYRKHSGSTTHRLTGEALRAIHLVDREARLHIGSPDKRLKSALDARTRSIETALAFDRLVAAIKRRDVANACRVAMDCPGALMLLRHPIGARLKWRGRTAAKARTTSKRQVCILTRQRVIGATNGSSIYLLSLVQALAQRGVDVHFLSPSPTILGRWPYLALRKEMDVFRTIRVRGTWRFGRYLVALDPRLFFRGALAVIEKAMLRSGLLSEPVLRSAPYAIACPLTRQDQLFVARHAPPIGDILVADYCFLTATFPYALRPDANTAVIMHDLFSSRGQQFASLGAVDATVALGEDEECAMLAEADTVVAIQMDEAKFLQERIPQNKVVVAPIAALPVRDPQPGMGDQLLFVGSAAAANVNGLRWFLGDCWPEIRKTRPSMALRVAGTVCDKVGAAPPGVEFLGVVEDLDPLYAEAGVVFSPLRAGSGLKIKLIEALGKGKAMVATAITLQGVEHILRDCICVADDPERFVAAILDLGVDDRARIALAERGLAAIRKYFSPEACYREFVESLIGGERRAWDRQG